MWLLTGIILFGYALGEILDWLNLQHSKAEIPPEAEGIYDQEQYAKSQRYHQVTARFSFITTAFSTILTLAILWLGGFGWLDNLLAAYTDNEIWLALAFFGALFFASDIINIPFQLYATFVIEEKYGFNKTSLKTFFLDKLKGYVLGIRGYEFNEFGQKLSDKAKENLNCAVDFITKTLREKRFIEV